MKNDSARSQGSAILQKDRDTTDRRVDKGELGFVAILGGMTQSRQLPGSHRVTDSDLRHLAGELKEL